MRRRLIWLSWALVQMSFVGITLCPASEDSNRRQLLQSALNLLDSPEQVEEEDQLDQQIVERLNQWRADSENSAAKTNSS